jgi:TRAP-type C4-dicarboxylate transport system substrate-binding protein
LAFASDSSFDSDLPEASGPVKLRQFCADGVQLMSRPWVRRGLLTAWLLGAGVLSASAQTALDLSTVWPDSNFHTQNAKRFAEEVKKASNGAVAITVKAGGQLGFKGPEHLRAVRDGLVPMADVLNIQQIGDEPVLGTEGIPFLVSSSDELRALHKHLRPVYDQVAAKNNQKILYMVPWPTQYLHLKVKVDTLDGLKGIKIRVPDKNAADMLTAIAMSPVLIPWGETIPALASGAVAGVSTSAVSGVDGKFWEFLKTVYPTNHVWSSQIVTINLDTWKKLKPEEQKALEETAKRLEPEFWQSSIKADTDSLARLKENGMELVTIPEPMMKAFREKTAPILGDFMKRVPASEAPIKAYLADMKR